MDYFSVFIQMLQAKGLADNTIRSYKTYIKPYLKYLSSISALPEDASWQIMRDYLSWIRSERNLSDRTINMIISYLQFFHMYVLHKPWDKTQIPFRKFNIYLPFVPSRKEVHTFISSLENPKVRLAVSILYATGLRLDELCHLKCKDIISSAKKIHVADSKNHRDRFVPMPDMIWQMILSYYRNLPDHMKPNTWLFTQQRSTCNPMDKQWFQKIILDQRSLLGMSDKLTSHSFRHSCASLLLANGVPMKQIQKWLGHSDFSTTANVYAHLDYNSKILSAAALVTGLSLE